MADSTNSRSRLTTCLIPIAIASIAITSACSRSPAGVSEADDATRVRLSQIAEASGDIDGQLALLATAASREPGNRAAQIRYATALADAGRNREALLVGQSAYSRDNGPTSLGLLIGRLQIRMDQGAAAGATYHDILAREADNIEALNGLGIVDEMQGALPAAEANFRRAADIAPTHNASRNNLALVLALEGRTAEAIPMLESLLREDSSSRRIRSNLALAYSASGDRAKAVELLSPLMSASEVDKIVGTYSRLDRNAQAAISHPDPEQTAVLDNGSNGIVSGAQRNFVKRNLPTGSAPRANQASPTVTNAPTSVADAAPIHHRPDAGVPIVASARPAPDAVPAAAPAADAQTVPERTATLDHGSDGTKEEPQHNPTQRILPTGSTVSAEPAAPVMANSPTSAAAAAPSHPPDTEVPVVAPVRPAPEVVLAAARAPVKSRILLRASANAWIEVKDPSGTALMRRMIKGGETLPLPQGLNLSLTVGNAGGVEVLVDGVTIGSLGLDGAVRHLALDADLIKRRKLAEGVAPRPTPARLAISEPVPATQ